MTTTSGAITRWLTWRLIDPLTPSADCNSPAQIPRHKPCPPPESRRWHHDPMDHRPRQRSRGSCSGNKLHLRAGCSSRLSLVAADSTESGMPVPPQRRGGRSAVQPGGAHFVERTGSSPEHASLHRSAPDIASAARWPRMGTGRTFVPDPRAAFPAIDHATTIHCGVAAGSAAIVGTGRADPRKCSRQRCRKQPFRHF
jgi:hypothetical protein